MKTVRVHRHAVCPRCARHAARQHRLDWPDRFEDTTEPPPTGPVQKDKIAIQDLRSGRYFPDTSGFVFLFRQIPAYWPLLLAWLPPVRRWMEQDLDPASRGPAVIGSPRLVMARKSIVLAAVPLVLCLLTACGEQPPQALGTLEYDRIVLPAPVAERIVSIDVREGQQVVAGAKLLTLERTRTEAQTQALRSEAQRQRAALGELEAGARSEQIAQARASLAAAQAAARDANAYYARLRPLGARQLVAAADVDRARAASSSADAQVRQAQAALDELLNGSRREDIAQGQAAVSAAEAQVAAQQATLDKLDVLAPRAGRVDSLPYRLGDQAPVGAPLAVLLVGDAPYARVYVPEPIRANVKVGDAVRVHVDGRDAVLQGRVRMIRSEPSFTPYYALVGKDAARLSYLAEISLDKDAAQLPAGLPVRVDFNGETAR